MAALGAIAGAALGIMQQAGPYVYGAMMSKEAFDRTKYLMRHRYQYAVADLKRAGLNPILAVQNPPPMAQAPVVGLGPSSQKSLISSAREGAAFEAELRRARAEARISEANATIREAEMPGAEAKEEILRDVFQYIRRAWSGAKDVVQEKSKVKLQPIEREKAAQRKTRKGVDVDKRERWESGSSGEVDQEVLRRQPWYDYYKGGE